MGLKKSVHPAGVCMDGRHAGYRLVTIRNRGDKAMSKILLVEDDLPLSAGLCFELDTSGYLTVAAYHCRKALKQDVLKGFDYETGHCSGR